MQSPACCGTKVSSSENFTTTKVCRSNRYFRHQTFYTSNPLYYTFIVVLLPVLCTQTSVAIYCIIQTNLVLYEKHKIPKNISCLQPSFTRRTSGHCLGDIWIENINFPFSEFIVFFSFFFVRRIVIKNRVIKHIWWKLSYEDDTEILLNMWQFCKNWTYISNKYTNTVHWYFIEIQV